MNENPSEASPAPDATKRRPGKWLRRWKWFWRSSVVLLLAVYFTRNLVLGPWVLGKIEEVLAESLGGPVELDGIGGNWWSRIELATARTLEDADATPVQSFTVSGVEAQYSLWSLLRGEEAWLARIQIDAVELVVDGRQGSASEPSEEQEAAAPPARIPQLEIASMQLVYRDDEMQAAMRAASLQSPEAGRLLLQIPELDFARGEQVAPTTSVATELHYAGGLLEIPSLMVDDIERVQTARLDLSAVAQGQLGFDLALSVLEGGVQAQGDLRDGRVQATVSAQGLIAEQLEPYLDLGLRGQLDFTGSVDWPLAVPLDGVAQFEFGAAQNGWRRVELEAITGSLRVAQGWLVSEEFRAQGPDLHLIARDCRLPLFAEDPLAAATGGTIELRVDDLPGWLDRLELELPPEAGTLQSLALDAQLRSLAERVEVQLDRLQLNSGMGSWTAQGQTALFDLQLAAESPVELQLEGSEVSLAELGDFLREHGRIEEGVPMPNAGRASLSLEVTGTAAQPRLALTVRVVDLDPGPLHEQLPRGPYQSQLSLVANGQTLRIEPFVLSSPELECTLQAESQLPLDLVALSTGELPSLAGALAADLVLRASLQGPYSGTAELRADLTSTLDEDLMPTTSAVEWTLAGEQLAADELTAQIARLQASGSASWQGIEPLPVQWQAMLHAEELRREAGRLAALRTEASWSEQRLRARVDSSEDGNFPLLLDAELPLDLAAPTALPEGPLTAQLSFAQPLDLAVLKQQAEAWGLPLPVEWQEYDAVGALVLGAQAEGSWQDPAIALSLVGESIEWIPRDPEVASPLPEPIDVEATLTQRGGRVELEKMHALSSSAEVNAQGEWTVDTALLPTLAAGEALPAGQLQFDAWLDLPDVSFLASLPGLRRIEGSAHAQVQVKGTDRAPEITADWSYRDGALRLEDPTLAAFERLTFAGRFANQKLELVDCQGELGSAPFVATGTVDLASEVPQIDVQLDGTDLLLYRREGVKVRSDTALRIHGPLDALRTEGDVTLTDGRYTKPVDFILPLLRKGQPPTGGVEGISLFSLTPPLDTMALDLRVHPGSGFRIKTNVANGMIRPDLRLIGTGEVPYLLGEIYFDRTILNMPAHRITLEQGVIRFTEDSPFVPTLDLRAGFRRYGYEVTIIVEGDVTAPVITMSSVPPLSAEELLLFTTTGQPPQENTNAQEALGTVAVYLAQDWLRRFFGDLSTEEEESLFDRIEIEFGRDSTNQGAETIEGRFLLRRNNLLENDALYLTGERDAYSDFNLGLRIRFLFP